MNRTIESIVGAIVALGLAAVSVLLGVGLLPSLAAAQERGTLVPWFLTWGMIWTTALIAVALAGFLAMTGLSKEKSQV